jgi:DNA-directed RNA polymerase specialized sigma24 family protein
VQSVYRSFFQRRGAFAVADTQQLWKLLVFRTCQKCGKKLRGLFARKRDFTREVPLEAPAVPAAPAGPAVEEEPDLDGEESYEHLVKTLRDALERLTPPTYRDIIERVLRGEETPEIVRSLGCSDRSVRRAKEKFRELLLKEGRVDLPWENAHEPRRGL